MKHKRPVPGAVALAVVGLSTTSVSADPKPGLDITLTCDEQDYDVSVAGNGAWTPAHDLTSTLVGVPIAFGEFVGEFTPTGGEPQPFTDPPFSKPNSPRTSNVVIDCTYIVSGTFPDGTVSGSGSVTLMVPRVK